MSTTETVQNISPFAAFAILALAAGAAESINSRLLKLPSAMGLVVISLVAAGIIALIDLGGFPIIRFIDATIPTDQQFRTYFIDSALAFMLYSAAVSVDRRKLRLTVVPVLFLATVGVLLSTGLVALAVMTAGDVMGIQFEWREALLFGAIISPTDALVVVPIVKAIPGARAWKSVLEGESLFNDAMALVLVVLLSQMPSHQGEAATVSAFLLDFARAAGLAVGIGVGSAVIVGCVVSIGPHSPIGRILLSVGLATGSYVLAEDLDASGPIAVISAGITYMAFISRTSLKGPRGESRIFWMVISDGLAAIFFFLIGLEVLTTHWSWFLVSLAVIVWLLVLFARFGTVIAAYFVSSSVISLGPPRSFILPLSLGGVRGAISIALVLSLAGPYIPPHMEQMVTMTFGTVILGLLLQGGVLRLLQSRLAREEAYEARLRKPLRVMVDSAKLKQHERRRRVRARKRREHKRH